MLCLNCDDEIHKQTQIRMCGTFWNRYLCVFCSQRNLICAKKKQKQNILHGSQNKTTPHTVDDNFVRGWLNEEEQNLKIVSMCTRCAEIFLSEFSANGLKNCALLFYIQTNNKLRKTWYTFRFVTVVSNVVSACFIEVTQERERKRIKTSRCVSNYCLC